MKTVKEIETLLILDALELLEALGLAPDKDSRKFFIEKYDMEPEFVAPYLHDMILTRRGEGPGPRESVIDRIVNRVVEEAGKRFDSTLDFIATMRTAPAPSREVVDFNTKLSEAQVADTKTSIEEKPEERNDFREFIADVHSPGAAAATETVADFREDLSLLKDQPAGGSPATGHVGESTTKLSRPIETEASEHGRELQKQKQRRYDTSTMTMGQLIVHIVKESGGELSIGKIEKIMIRDYGKTPAAGSINTLISVEARKDNARIRRVGLGKYRYIGSAVVASAEPDTPERTKIRAGMIQCNQCPEFMSPKSIMEHKRTAHPVSDNPHGTDERSMTGTSIAGL